VPVCRRRHGAAVRNVLGAFAIGVVALIGHAPRVAVDGPAVQHALQRLALDGLGDIVVHTRAHALLALALYRRGRYCHDRDRAGGRFVRFVVPDQVRRAVAVDYGHLHVHENDVGLGVGYVGGVGCDEVVEGFAPIPDCGDRVAQFTHRAKGDLLVDRATRKYVSPYQGQV
jgi:hypothetical protein